MKRAAQRAGAALHVCKVLQLAVAVPDAFFRNAHPIQHRQEQIRHRGLLGISKMASALDLARGAAGQQDRQIIMGMHIAVAQAAAVHDHRPVQQIGIAVRSRTKLVQKIRESLDVMGVDLCKLVDFYLIALMV